MRIINKFLEEKDFKEESYRRLLEEFDCIYSKVFNKKPDTYGAKFPDKVKIHWSRDWEYPWAVINSDVRAGERVIDCGCGGSPLLPFLAQFGCEAYGVDPDIFRYMTIRGYYLSMIRRGFYELKSLNRKEPSCDLRTIDPKMSISYRGFIRKALKSLRRPTDLWGFTVDPNKLGYKIKFFAESLDRMHFEDNYFDKVFCISVLEHLPKTVAYKGLKEMVRVLKRAGLLVITMDNEGPHVNPDLVGKYEELITVSGLQLHGDSDFRRPKPESVPGEFNVVGFILRK